MTFLTSTTPEDWTPTMEDIPVEVPAYDAEGSSHLRHANHQPKMHRGGPQHPRQSTPPNNTYAPPRRAFGAKGEFLGWVGDRSISYDG